MSHMVRIYVHYCKVQILPNIGYQIVKSYNTDLSLINLFRYTKNYYQLHTFIYPSLYSCIPILDRVCSAFYTTFLRYMLHEITASKEYAKYTAAQVKILYEIIH